MKRYDKENRIILEEVIKIIDNYKGMKKFRHKTLI